MYGLVARWPPYTENARPLNYGLGAARLLSREDALVLIELTHPNARHIIEESFDGDPGMPLAEQSQPILAFDQGGIHGTRRFLIQIQALGHGVGPVINDGLRGAQSGAVLRSLGRGGGHGTVMGVTVPGGVR